MHLLKHSPIKNNARGRRILFASPLLVGALIFTPSSPANADLGEGDVEDLGVAMQAPNVRLSDVGTLSDGTPVAYLFSDGEPVSFDVVDMQTGDLLDSHQIDPYTVASAIDVADDGTVYLSVRAPNDATLWQYDPESRVLTEIATGIAGEEMIRTLDVQDDMLYGTTFPGAQVFAMNTADRDLTTYGSITDDGDYGWGLEASSDEVFVGAGTPAQLFRLDPGSGRATPIDLPEDVATEGEFIQRIETYEDLMVVSHREVEGGTLSVYDGTEWVDRVPVGGMWLYTEQTADNAFYYLDEDDQPHMYDIKSRSSSPIDLSETEIDGETSGTSRIFLTDLGLDSFPGTTLVGIRTDGQMWRYNLATGAGELLELEAFGSPVTTMSIGEGGDGDVYVGAYLSPGIMARVSTETGEVEQLDGPEQADSIIAHDAQTIIATYPEAVIYAAEADQEWSWGDNPRHLFTLGRKETGQDRPRHMEVAGDLVAIGTIPNYGELGGALTLFDPQTGEYDVHRNVVEEQSVTDLAYNDGLIYGGTSIHGGLDTSPTQQTAEVFVWDIEAEELIARSTPVDGAEVIHALVADDAGAIWGMSDNGTLFEYDPLTHEVARTIETEIVHTSTWAAQSGLQFRAEDGLIYGHAGGQLFRFDPKEPELESLLDSGVARATLAAGAIYFTNETNVFRYSPPAISPIKVDPPAATFTDGARPGEGIVTIPDAEGVEYLIDGELVDAGTHPGFGTVTVTARALEGYVLLEGATTRWSHTFESDASDSPIPDPTQEPKPSKDPEVNGNDGSGQMPSTGFSPNSLVMLTVSLLSGAIAVFLIRKRLYS